MLIRIGLPMLSLVISTWMANAAMAERPHQDRTKADVALEGTVVAVYQQDTQHYTNYIVELSVSKVLKGQNIKVGERFRAFCFQAKPTKQMFMGASGHSAVPKVGSQVRIFMMRKKGQNEGIYPNWMDLIKKSPIVTTVNKVGAKEVAPDRSHRQ